MEEERSKYIPLTEKMRPQKLSEVIGQKHLIGDGKILKVIAEKGEPTNLIFWGPPGTGKTTLARILAKTFTADFIEISAVSAGKKEINDAVEKARQNWRIKIRTVLFIDEIHRFNKAQQDVLLPHIESGLITLLGATTENPSFEIISPLLSRTRVVILEALKNEEVTQVLKRAMKTSGGKREVEEGALEYLAELSGGDARYSVRTLELALSLDERISIESIKNAAGKKLPGYDKNGDAHYHNISAFIKSMRAGSPDATLYYLARMLQAGEDARFIARRMIIFASEDVGLAGNGALNLAISANLAVERVGMPESGIILSHVASALALAKKSRLSYNAWRKAEELSRKSFDLPVPISLRNANSKLEKDLGYTKSYKWETGFRPDGSLFPDGLGEQKFF